VPRRLKRSFPTHEVLTAGDVGWDGLRNGKLLAVVATRFQVFLTIDKNIKNQQNLATLPVAVVVIMARTNRFEDIAPFVPVIEETLKILRPCTLVEVFLPSP